MKIRQSRVDRAAARERCAEAKPWPEVVAVAETTFLTSARFAGNIRAVLARENDLAAIIIIVVQTRHERHEFPSCDGEIRDRTPCGLTKPAN